MSDTNRLSVIGCGNLNRSDDGVGPHVIALLKDLLPATPHVALFDAGTAGIDVMFQARGSERLIIVDACQSGHPPGALFKVPGDQLQQAFDHQTNLHSFRWQHALYAGQQIFDDAFPADVDVWLIEAQSLGFGLTLSKPVADTAAKLATLLCDEALAFSRRIDSERAA